MSIALRYSARGTRQDIIEGREPAWLLKHPRYGYLRAAYLSVMPWVCRDELKWLHWCKNAWIEATGVEHVLDHIVPLNHAHVCGLTVPWNLRLVPRAANATKGGRWSPEQGELWDGD